MGFFQAYKHYGEGADGYRLDGYNIVEHIDGYEPSQSFSNLADVAAVKRHLERVDYMLLRTIDIRVPDQQKSSPHAALYKALMEQNRISGEVRTPRLLELRMRYAALYNAIQNADGYQ